MTVFWGAGIQKSKNMVSLIICPSFGIRRKINRKNNYSVPLRNDRPVRDGHEGWTYQELGKGQSDG